MMITEMGAAQIRAATRAVAEAERRKFEAAEAARRTRSDLNFVLRGELGIERASATFFWDCPTSPTGGCVYDDDQDRCHDYCLFCGDPEERK